MNFTINTIAQSLASYLEPFFKGVTFYQNPNQQGTSLPCLFLQQRYSYTEKETGGFFLRRIGLDLVYLTKMNLPNLQELFQNVAEILDLNMDVFPYSDGSSETTTLIRTYNREWRIELNTLHYKFEIQERVNIPKDFIKMQVIEDYNSEVSE